ncbi:hypothetical protein V1282_006838 [Nitrobacteraceae bacterium AZCC 2146]
MAVREAGNTPFGIAGLRYQPFEIAVGFEGDVGVEAIQPVLLEQMRLPEAAEVVSDAARSLQRDIDQRWLVAMVKQTNPQIGFRYLKAGVLTANADQPAFALRPTASMPASAQISSLSEVSPDMPTAPSRTPEAS